MRSWTKTALLISFIFFAGGCASKMALAPKSDNPVPVVKNSAADVERLRKEQIAQRPREDLKKAEGNPSEKVYTGKKISLDFKDAEINHVLRSIADSNNLNVIIGKDVAGKISIRLIDVPWDQALDMILQANSLGMVRVGEVIRVAPLDTLHKETVATELIPVNYATVSELVPQVKGALSERGDVCVDERTKTLIVTDSAKHIERVKKLVKFLDRKTPQVFIEARIIEANLLFQKELGVKWGFLVDRQRGDSQFRSGGGLSRTTLGQLTRDVVDLPAVAQGSAMGVPTPGVIEFVFSRGSLRELDLSISAHENLGNVKLISSPKIATLDTKEASIEQGFRIPVRILNKFGVTSTELVEANLKLNVVPYVTNDGNLKLLIRARRDAPDFRVLNIDQVPLIDKKEAITEVLISDGGLAAIAGLYTIDQTDNNEGVPLFNKIPIIGWLFKRQLKENIRRDLMIFISPKIFQDQLPGEEKLK